MQAQQELNDYFQRMIELRRAAPRDDLISDMVHAEEAGDHMTDEEIVTQCNLLLIAGNVTTTDLIGNGVKALLDHPQELAKLRARPELINNAIEEILRYDSPVTNSGRNVQRELSMRGCPMQLGDSITVSLAAANHDPEVYPEPDRFDIERRHAPSIVRRRPAPVSRRAPGAGRSTESDPRIAPAISEAAAGPARDQYHAIPSFRGMSEFWVQSRG